MEVRFLLTNMETAVVIQLRHLLIEMINSALFAEKLRLKKIFVMAIFILHDTIHMRQPFNMLCNHIRLHNV